jgi:hypothetical protein
MRITAAGHRSVGPRQHQPHCPPRPRSTLDCRIDRSDEAESRASCACARSFATCHSASRSSKRVCRSRNGVLFAVTAPQVADGSDAASITFCTSACACSPVQTPLTLIYLRMCETRKWRGSCLTLHCTSASGQCWVSPLSNNVVRASDCRLDERQDILALQDREHGLRLGELRIHRKPGILS